MSNKKLLIQEVFKRARNESGKEAKSAIASYLEDHFDKQNFGISGKTFIRYYEDYIVGNKERNIPSDILDKLSQYLEYKNFSDFSRTFIKDNCETNSTTIKINVDEDEESITEKLSKIIINITNKPIFTMPEFMTRQSSLGIGGLVIILLFFTGNAFLSHKKGKEANISSMNFFTSEPIKPQECMYWGGNEYKLAYCNDKNPQHDNLVPIDTIQLKYFKKITRPDTLTVENSMGIVWYDKSNNNVEFFTNYGKHPENGKMLKDVTERILNNYAGIENK